ncbi:MAG: DUF4430 domain-containing protein [Anaerostipes sp.]|nr:DUF4430 domain-containing protein [Anaerostipes sp.]
MKENKAKIIAVIGIFLILAGTVAGVFWAKGRNPKKNKTSHQKTEAVTTTSRTEGTTKEIKKTKKVKKTKKAKPTTTEKKTTTVTTSKKKDKYKTDPTPEGKPAPKEPENTKVDTAKTYTCTIQIVCKTVLSHREDLKDGKEEIVPKDGVILKKTKVSFSKGQNAYDVLLKATREHKIHFESSNVPGYNTRYIEGIGNLYEKDCGELSGWMYQVNGWFPNYGCSRYEVKNGDTILWQYTCDLGEDIGGNNG